MEGDETFTATLSTSVAGWVAASSGASATITIQDDDDDNAKVAFGTSATATAKHAVSVAEDVSGGRLQVPVTISDYPGASTTFAVGGAGHVDGDGICERAEPERLPHRDQRGDVRADGHEQDERTWW